LTEEYYMVLTETTNSQPDPVCGTWSPVTRWGFTNKGVSLGASCDNADTISPPSDAWGDRVGLSWYCF
jgi:hypothetical protein